MIEALVTQPGDGNTSVPPPLDGSMNAGQPKNGMLLAIHGNEALTALHGNTVSILLVREDRHKPPHA